MAAQWQGQDALNAGQKGATALDSTIDRLGKVLAGLDAQTRQMHQRVLGPRPEAACDNPRSSPSSYVDKIETAASYAEAIGHRLMEIAEHV